MEEREKAGDNTRALMYYTEGECNYKEMVSLH